MQSAVSRDEVKYWAPCDDKAWQQILRDIQLSAFPLCRTVAQPKKGETDADWDQPAASPFKAGYMPAPNRNPFKICLVDPAEAYCSVSFKYGHVVVRTPEPRSPVQHEMTVAYLKRVCESRGKAAHWTKRKGSLFKLDPRVVEAKLRAKHALLTAASELEAVYRDSLPIRVGER